MSEFLQQNWGNVASVLGLGVSVWVLLVAQKAREAAEQARTTARLRNLVEVLTEAGNQVHQLGSYLAGDQWGVARFLAGEVAGACRLSMERWGDALDSSSRRSLVDLSRIAKSIAVVADEARMRQISAAERRQILDAQLAAIDLISATVGRARGVQEKR